MAQGYRLSLREPRILAPRTMYNAKVAALVAAAIEYEDQVSNRGPEPLAAGARLRIAAKECAKAARAAGVLP